MNNLNIWVGKFHNPLIEESLKFHKEFIEQVFYMIPSKEQLEKDKKAFEALLAYEKNCIAKYDYPDWMGKPSKPPIKGERMEDFAFKFGTTIEEMKLQWRLVEYYLKNDK